MTPLAFIFTYPLTALAAGVGAVSIPIIIHLLNRRRFRVVTWAAMRFLLLAQKKNSRRMRLEQLILLAVRCALVLLLVLAMASVMPAAERFWHWLFPESVAFAALGTQRTHKIIVIDGSFSMATKTGDKDCFERAKELAVKIVRDQSSRGDGFNVVLMAAPPRRIVLEPSENTDKVVEAIQKLRLPHGNADLAATLNTVENLLRASPGKFESREVYFLTDLQQSTWISKQPGSVAGMIQKIQERTRTTVLVDAGVDGVSNTAVTNVILGATLAGVGVEVPIIATIHNYGQKPREDVTVDLLIGKAREQGADTPYKLSVAERRSVKQLDRGANTISFKHKFRTPGDYVVQVRVTPDALELDDARSFVVTVKKELPVLLVNGKPAVQHFDRATGWLHLALNPFGSERVVGMVPARPKVISEDVFNDAGLGDLSPYDCVFFCGVRSFTPAEVHRIEMHLRRGGGVVFGLGDKVDRGAYNELLYRDGGGILPARLLKEQPAPSSSYYHFFVDDRNYREPPLDAFTETGDRLSLVGARFRQYVSVELAPRGQPRKVLSFMPAPIKERGAGAEEAGKLPRDEPALIEWRPPLPAGGSAGINPAARYRGRVILFTSTFNMDWNSWPASPSSPAFAQELLRFAVSGRLREQSVTVGEPLEEFFAKGGGEEVTLRIPDGRKETLSTEPQEETSVLRWTDTDASGVYVATIGHHPREHVFAVNVPASTDSQQASESDLTRTNLEQLRQTYPEWDLQVVTELKAVVHASGEKSDPDADQRPLGTEVARWLLLLVLVLLLAEVVLAWRFGHYSSVAGGFGQPPAKGLLLPALAAGFAVVTIGTLAAVLGSALWTDDFLSFLPDSFRGWLLGVNVPPPAPGEGSRWRPEFSPYLWDAASDPWLAGAIAIGGLVLIIWIYRLEGNAVSTPYKLLMAGMRFALLLLLLTVILPQTRVCVERQGWPDLVVIIDDSMSMSTVDKYRDPEVRAAAEQLSNVSGLSSQERLALAQALLTREKPDWLRNLLEERQVKVHVYHCSTRAHRISDVTTAQDLGGALKSIRELRADSKNDSSQLGAAVRQAINDFRGSSLPAVIMLTDGVTTEGEDLVKVSHYAAQMGVPLFFVGIGDSLELRDLILHDVQAADAVYVNDRLIFSVNVTGQGYTSLDVPVRLYEKGKEDGKPLDEKHIKAGSKSQRVTLVHRPSVPGEKTYVIKVPVQNDESSPDNNRLEKSVFVLEAKIHKVLYVEQYPRYEYRFIKSLLERESALTRGNKGIDLRVLLIDADEEYAKEDRSALADFPTKAELNQFDVVILGDVDPHDPHNQRSRKLKEHLKDLADFVRERGGGLLMIAGQRNAPRVYRETPLKDVLPIDLTGAVGEEPPDRERTEGFRPELTPIGRMHPIFQFGRQESQNDEIWGHLREMYWYAEGYQPKRAAEVLAVHPTLAEAKEGSGRSEGKHALVVQQFVGAGRCMFFGFDETWRWRFREDEGHFNQFWVQTIRYLATNRLGRIDLRLNKQVPYRRGEPITVTVRFPDDSPPPPAKTEVKVLVERRPPAANRAASVPVEGGKAAPVEVQTIKLAKKDDGSRATYEATMTRTPEGEYLFMLSAPTSPISKPTAECRVLAPPGEMELLRMNREDMERAALETHGHFYTLANADRLLDELPPGTRVTLNAAAPPALLWNNAFMFLAAMMFVSLEWILRKRKHLL
jgi:hypothetical protein